MLRSLLARLSSPDKIAALVVACAPVLYFLPAARGRLVLAPDDGLILNLPLRAIAARILLDGHLPLWNPYIFGGMPLWATAQGGLLMPLNWTFLIFSPPVAMNLTVLATYSLAGVGAYFYARANEASIGGALVTALVWQWSGFLVAHIGHTNVIQTAALLPWILLAVDKYAAIGKRAWAIMLAALVACSIFAGHQQMFVYSLALVAAYITFKAIFDRAGRRFLLQSFVMIFAGIGLAAVQILPTIELMHNSVRASVGGSYEFLTSLSFPPSMLPTFLAPYLWGGGDAEGLFRAPYTGPPFYGEYAGYVGSGALALAALAVLLRRDAQTKFWAAVALTALALALGGFWPFDLYRIVHYIPGFNLFRAPARHLMEVDFALAVLAGRGLTMLTANESERRATRTRAAIITGVALCLLTYLAVTWWRPEGFRLGREAPVSVLRAPELFMPVLVALIVAWALWRAASRKRKRDVALLIGVVVFDLVLWGQASGWRLAPRLDDALWREPPPAAVTLRNQNASPENYRILSVVNSFYERSSFAASRFDAAKFMRTLQPNVSMLYGTHNAAGSDGFGVARYSHLADDMEMWGAVRNPARSLTGGREFDLLNVRYLILPRPEINFPRSPPATVPVREIGGYGFAPASLDTPLLTRASPRLSFIAPRVAADRIALVTSLAYSAGIPDGEIIARIKLRANDERIFELALRAGVHTSEWAHDRPDVARIIRHARAPIATSARVEAAESDFESHTYLAALELPERATIIGGEIELAPHEASPQLSLSVERASFVETGGATVPLMREWLNRELPGAPAPPASGQEERPRWRRIGLFEDASVYENTRALPRAWLATEAVHINRSEAILNVIRTGRFENDAEWNPRRTALIETPAAELGATLEMTESAAGEATITLYEPNRIHVRTSSPTRAMLVLSENFYPGWTATVDEEAARIERVNYNLRGVALAPGNHEVRFVYCPRSLLLGLIVSLLTLAALSSWAISARRKKTLRLKTSPDAEVLVSAHEMGGSIKPRA